MIHTVHVDDTTAAGKRFMRDFHRVRKGIEFDNPANLGKTPEGYMTGDEFESNLIRRITDFYKGNGIL